LVEFVLSRRSPERRRSTPTAYSAEKITQQKNESFFHLDRFPMLTQVVA
jgi:hypothetical protein